MALFAWWAILIQYWRDRQTHDNSICRASIVSRIKNDYNILEILLIRDNRMRNTLTISADANTCQHTVNYVHSLHSSQYVFAFIGQQQKNIQCKVHLIRQPRHEWSFQFSIASVWLSDSTRQTPCLSGTICTYNHCQLITLEQFNLKILTVFTRLDYHTLSDLHQMHLPYTQW